MRLAPAPFLALTLALAGAALLTGCGSSADPAQDATPSVAVTTVSPQKGSATRRLTAYGSATPASNGSQTLSVAQPGQVVRVMVTPGAAVVAGQPILAFAVAPTALAGFEAATTTLAAAIKARDTTAQLLAQQLATRDQLTQADKAVADARAALAAMRREGAGAASQILAAPFAGIVTAIPVAQGDRTQPGAALATIVRKGAIIVTVGVDPASAAGVRAGQAATLAPLSGGTAIDGRVLRVDAQLNTTTHLIDVDLGFSGAAPPGQTFRADIAVGESSGWIVPHAAVVTSGDAGARVFQVAGGKAKAVPVEVVQTDAARDVVTGAIDPARPLIVDGAYQVDDGGAVRAAR